MRKRIQRIWHATKRTIGRIKMQKKTNERAPTRSLSFGAKNLLYTLSIESTYIPELTRLHNSLLRHPMFYPETEILVVTGKQETDRQLQKNSEAMGRLREQIRSHRTKAKGTKKHADMLRELDAAQKLEQEFSNMKDKNLRLLLEHFKTQKPGSAEHKKHGH